MIAGGVSGGQAGDAAKQVGDGAAPGGQDGRDEQEEEAPVGRLEEDGGESGEQRLGEGWYNEHEDHLVVRSRGAVVTSHAPIKVALFCHYIGQNRIP